jgi:hypothetical protein
MLTRVNVHTPALVSRFSKILKSSANIDACNGRTVTAEVQLMLR